MIFYVLNFSTTQKASITTKYKLKLARVVVPLLFLYPVNDQVHLKMILFVVIQHVLFENLLLTGLLLVAAAVCLSHIDDKQNELDKTRRELRETEEERDSWQRPHSSGTISLLIYCISIEHDGIVLC